jgi:hypothetical protein
MWVHYQLNWERMLSIKTNKLPKGEKEKALKYKEELRIQRGDYYE